MSEAKGIIERPRVGDALPALVLEPTEVQLFAFSAITWNTHRIHYDADYARDVEGYPGVLVQAHLHACFLARALAAAFGPGSRIARLGWQNRGIAVAGDRLTITGAITEVDGRRVALELEERNGRDELCVKGWATVDIDGEAS